MSHFTVAIITSDKPSRADLDAVLAPWHEFECTGRNDQYVRDIDTTVELREAYESGTQRRLKGPDGALHLPWDDRFYRDPTEDEKAKVGHGTGCGGGLFWTSRDWGDGKGYRAKINFVPDGFEEVHAPTLHLMSFREFVAGETSAEKEVLFGAEPDLVGPHKFGYTLLAEDGSVVRVVDRTNPDRKWDWWKVGGRWTGMLKLLPGRLGIVGEPGLCTDPAKSGYVDSARVADIDFDGIRDEKGQEAGAEWDRFRAIVGLDATWRSWAEVRRSGITIDAARDIFHAQDAMRRLRESGDRSFDLDTDDYLVSREAYEQNARDGACVTFAVVKDGAWYERGEMGWWACVSNELERSDWNKRFAELLDGLPRTAWLTIVDCHI